MNDSRKPILNSVSEENKTESLAHSPQNSQKEHHMLEYFILIIYQLNKIKPLVCLKLTGTHTQECTDALVASVSKKDKNSYR